MYIHSRLVLLMVLAASSVVGIGKLSAQPTLVSSLSNTAISVLPASPTSRWANSFTTGATSSLLNSVTFKYQSNQSTDTTISAFVYSSAGSVPGSLLATATPAVLGNNNGSLYEAQVSLNFAGGFTLSPNTNYFMVSGASQEAFGVAGNNSSQTGLSGFSIYANSMLSSNGGASYPLSSNGALFALSGSAIPEPSTYAAIFGVAALGLAVWRRRNRTVPVQGDAPSCFTAANLKCLTSVGRVCAILLAILAVFVPAKAQSILVNGGFESPGLASPTNFLVNWTTSLPNGSTFVTGWVSVNNIASNVANTNNVYCRGPYYGNAASEGEHFIYLDNNNYSSPSLNGIYQDFSSVTGQTYQVKFDATTELGGSAGKLGVSVGGSTFHLTLANAGLPPVSSPPYTPFTPWVTYSLTFTANSTTTRLFFFDEGFYIGGNPSNGNASPLLDNVSVSAIPEPSTYAAIFGLSALGFAAYRKRQISV